MLGFKFDAGHRAGVKHQAADALSRLRTEGTDKITLKDDLSAMVIHIMDAKTHDCPSDMLEDIDSTLVHVKPE